MNKEGRRYRRIKRKLGRERMVMGIAACHCSKVVDLGNTGQ